MMRSILLALLMPFFGVMAYAAPNFITPEMLYRRGLTDEQYQILWKKGRNPMVDVTTARNWMFKSFRYENCTNWLNIVGKSNDYARLSFTLQDENFKLSATNDILVTANAALKQGVRHWMDEYNTMSNMYVIASTMANVAQSKIEGEIADLREKITKYEEYKTRYPVLKTVWNALIEDAENRIKVLEALAG